MISMVQSTSEDDDKTAEKQKSPAAACQCQSLIPWPVDPDRTLLSGAELAVVLGGSSPPRPPQTMEPLLAPSFFEEKE